MHTIKYTILCVDDNENNLFTLKSLLKTESHIEVITALSADEALKILLKEHIDLILLDIQMPIMNGFEFAKLIQSNKKTKEIPIVFLTAVFKSEEFIQEGFQLGAIDYLTKPIDDVQLLNKINLYLQIFEQKNQAIANKKKFYAIAQSINDGIFSLNLDDKVTFINKRALELLQYKEEELLNSNIHDIIHYKNKDNANTTHQECPICQSSKNTQSYCNENEYFIKKDTSFLPVTIYTTPLYTDNQFSGTLVSFKDNTKENLLKIAQEENIKTKEELLHMLVDMIESRDSYTAGHTKRVAKYCGLIAKEMGYTKEEIQLIEKAAWLHDIGKISTPDAVLLKPAKLNNLEYKLIQEHLNSGYELLSKIHSYKKIAAIMREHHERYDGKGYPRGLKGNEISPLGRIMIVADAFDAMTTNRIYKQSKTIPDAIKELQELKKIQFHPEVVDAAARVLKDVDVASVASQSPTNALEKERFDYFYKDRLTSLFIADYLPIILREHEELLFFTIIRLHNFSHYNKTHSWKEGDKLLQDFANFLQNHYQKDFIFRIEGDDFLIASEHELQAIDENTKAFLSLSKNELHVTIQNLNKTEIKKNLHLYEAG